MAELRYKVFVDDAEAKRKIAALLKGAGVSGQSGEAKKTASSIDDVRAATVKLKEAQLANIEALRQARLEQSKQKKDQADLNERYKQGQIDLQQFRLEQVKLTAEQKAQAKSARELKKQLADNSEYAKLTRALNNVRKETKDVLAEMFKLERQGYKSGAGYEHLRQKSDALTKQTVYLDNAVKRIDASVGQHQRKVGDYGRAMDNMIPIMGRLNSQLSVFGVTLDDLAKKPGAIKEIGTAFVDVGKSLLTFLISPVGLAISAIAGLFMLFKGNRQTVLDFNSGLRDVSKTTGIAGRDLRDFGGAITDLSMKLQVVSADKLLEYATVAGQLGVKGRADILAFTEALAMLETASNISGEEGGAEIARLLTLVDGGVQNVKDFGDEVVNLGNNFAATEREILSNAEAISQNVGLYRIGRQDVLAYATATKSLGIEAEVVGSTFQKTLGSFEKSIRSGKGVADILKVVGGSAADLQRRFREDASGVFQDYIRGLNEIHKAGGSVQAQMERNGIVDIRQRRVIGTLAAGYDTLSRAMNTVRDASGAMQAEFDNGSAKLINQTKRLGIAWDNFVLSIEDGEGAIAAVIRRLVDGTTILIDTINKAFNPTSGSELLARMTDQKLADSIREINKAMVEGEKQVKSLSSLSLSNISGDKLNDALKETKATISTVSEAYQLYKDKVNEGVLTDGGKNKLDDFKKTLDFLASKQWQLERLGASMPGSGIIPIIEESEEDKRKREAAEEKAKRKAEQATERRRQAVERQRSLQLSIDALNDQSTRKQLSRDEEEVASIRDKYAKIREEIRKFYADPKNKGLRVDMGGLNASETFETEEAERRILNRATLADIEEKKALYSQFEQYKLDVGLEKANELMRGQIDTTKTYLQFVEEALGKTLEIDPTEMTAAQKELYDALAKIQTDADKQEETNRNSRLIALLKEYATYEQKRKKIINDSEKAIAEFTKKRQYDNADEARKKRDEELKALSKTEIEGSEKYKEIMEAIDNAGRLVLPKALKLGQQTVKGIIDGLRKKKPELSKQLDELEKEYDKYFDKAINNAEGGKYDEIANLVQGFDQLVNMATQFDGTMGSAFKTIGGMISQVGQLAKSFSDVGSDLSKAGSSLGAVGAAFGFIGSVMSMVESSDARQAEIYQRDKAYRQDYQMKQIDAITKALEYQLQIIQDIYGTERVKAFAKTVEDSAKAFEDSAKRINTNPKYALTGNRMLDAYITRRNEGKASFSKAIDQMLDEMIEQGVIKQLEFGFSTVQNITHDQLKELYNMINNSSLDEVTRNQVQAIIDQYEIWRDAMNQMREELTGVSFSSITDGIVNMFEQGKNSVEDFTDFFEKQMQQSILKAFSRDSIEKQMQPWYELFAKYSEGGLSENEINELRRRYQDLMNVASQEWESLKQVTGQDFSSGSTSSVRSEGIERISEQSATEFIGLQRATLDINKQQLIELQQMKGNSATLVAIANNKLAALNAIQVNTANTVVELQLAVQELKYVNKNLGGKFGG